MSRKRVGWVVFYTTAGCLHDEYFELFETKEAAVAAATKIVDFYWENDRYANPNHKHYVTDCDEELRTDYDELYRSAKKVKSTVTADSINTDDELIIMPVFVPKKTKKKEKTNATKTKSKK